MASASSYLDEPVASASKFLESDSDPNASVGELEGPEREFVLSRLRQLGYDPDRVLGEELPFTQADIEFAAEEASRPLLSLSEGTKTAIGRGALRMVAGPFSSIIPERVPREIGASLGGLIEGATSPVGIATLPATVLAPAVMLPELIKGGIETGMQQIAEGQPIAGATTLGITVAPALAPLAKLPRATKALAELPEAAATGEVKPPPLPEQPPPLPGASRPAIEPVATPEPQPRPAAEPPPLPKDLPERAPLTPAAEQSLWQRLVDKHFAVTKPAEVFMSDTPVDAPTLDALTKAIKESKPARKETEALRTAERAQRASRQAQVQTQAPGKAGIQRLRSALAGELPRVDLEPFGDRIPLAQQDALFNHIYGHKLLEGDVYRKSNLAIALENLMENGALPQPNQVAWFERVFGPQVAQAMLGKQRVASRTLKTLAELSNIPRTIITGFDLSATGRQGFSLGVSHPLVAGRAMEAQLKAFADRNYALEVDRTFRVGDKARIRDRAGLELPSIEGLADLTREEVYTSRIIQNLQNIEAKTPLAKTLFNPIKAYARGLAGSERAYVTYLNWLRTNVFDAMDAVLKDSGLPDEVIAQKRHQAAMLINSATGRGNVPTNALLNAFFFSPKFAASRFEYPFRLAKVAGMDRTQLGKEARRQLAAHAAAWTSLYTLMHMASEAFDWPMSFGYDPRSADFLKVRMGNVAIDTGAGYGQAIRLMARFLDGQTVDVRGKEKRTDRASEVGRFLRYKLAPVPSEVWSIAEGKDPTGKPLTVPKVVADLTVPITTQEAHELWTEFGAAGLPFLVPEVLGLGVSVYDAESKRR